VQPLRRTPIAFSLGFFTVNAKVHTYLSDPYAIGTFGTGLPSRDSRRSRGSSGETKGPDPAAAKRSGDKPADQSKTSKGVSNSIELFDQFPITTLMIAMSTKI